MRYRSSGLARFARNRTAAVGLGMVILIVLISLAAPILPLANPNATDLAIRLKPPGTAGHLLGTDQLGRDILSRLIWGTRVSLAVGLVATFAAAVVGSLIGIIAAYYSRWLDNLLMRGIDMLMAFPYILLALAIVAILGPGLLNALLAISVVNIPFFARNVRGAAVGLVRLEYVDTARLSGLSNARILFGELLPNVLPVIMITISTTVGWMILETAGLSFLGLGAQPPQADLGSMLGDGRDLILIAPHVATIPGLVILVLVIGINLTGDGLRDVLDPQLKSGALASPAPMTAVDHTAAAANRAAGTAGALAVSGLSTSFVLGPATVRAVQNVSFSVAPGESLGVMGESGSGKSVTALSVLQLVPTPPGRITAGSVAYDGQELVGAPLSTLQNLRGNRIAFVFQNPMTALNPLLSVGEQIVESLRRHQGLRGRAARQKAIELLDAVHIPDAEARLTTYPHELSGGMRQRAGTAIALSNDPDVIIADEPTTALDVTIQAQILRLFNELRVKRGLRLVFISHDFGVLSEVCDRIVVMYAGQIVETGSVKEIYESPLHPYTRRLMACVPMIGRAEEPLTAIPGLPPDLAQLPSGCYFADRCDLAIERCRAAPIELRTMSQGRSARCVRAGETAV